jgi:hypothetical protein
MQDKYIYSILLLILVIVVSQIFAVILSIPVLKEGLECLPRCQDISFNPTKENPNVPPCKKLIAKLLTADDASSGGQLVISKFITNINNYIEQKYKFSTLFLPLYNLKITFPNAGASAGIQNNEQIKINKFFTDFSGIVHSTNQDILDNMTNDANFGEILDKFKYSQNKTTPSANIKENVKNTLTQYKTDRDKPAPELSSIYKQMMEDMSNYNISLQKRCNDYYTDKNFQTIIDTENNASKYYGNTSSFHRLDSYINDAMNGKLGTV